MNGDFAKADDATTSEKEFVEKETQPIKASISGTNITAATNVDVTPVADYIKTFTFDVTSAATKYAIADTTLKVIDTETALDAKTLAGMVKVKWASDPATAVAPDTEDVTKNFVMMVNGTAAETFDISGYAAGAKLPVTFSITGLEGIDTSKTKCEITSVLNVASLS